jgi:hypothetical protein
VTERTLVAAIDLHEGTLLYRDENGPESMPLLAALTVAWVVGPKGAQHRWVSKGPEGAVAETLAAYFLHNPGMLDAVHGMMQRMTKR